MVEPMSERKGSGMLYRIKFLKCMRTPVDHCRAHRETYMIVMVRNLDVMTVGSESAERETEKAMIYESYLSLETTLVVTRMTVCSGVHREREREKAMNMSRKH